MRIGYARVSITEQNLDLQRDALKRAGRSKIIEDTASGGKLHRSGLERVQDTLRSGDGLADTPFTPEPSSADSSKGVSSDAAFRLRRRVLDPPASPALP